VKQLGAHVIDHDTTGATHFEPEECWPDGTKTDHHRVLLKDKKGGDWSQWPEDLRIRQFPAPSREGGGAQSRSRNRGKRGEKEVR
jgi:hypothetical protein